MGMCIKEIEEMLGELHLYHFVNGTDEDLYIPFQMINENILIHVMLLENGRFIRFVVSPFKHLLYVKNKKWVIVKCMERNMHIKLLKYCYDSDTDNICLDIAIPLEDNTLTEAQLKRCLHYMTNVIANERSHFNYLLENGAWPETDELLEITRSVAALFRNSNIE